VAEEIHHPDGRIEHPGVQYERTDASFRGVLLVIVAAVVLAGVVQYGLLVFFESYRQRQAEVKRSPYPLAPEPSTALPREPRLEQIDRLAGTEAANVYEGQASREAILDSYGPTDQEGFIHIPIDRAIQLLQNKLPARAEPPAEQRARSEGLVDWGESNSGRLLRGRER
jgi:hypothetical protein